MKPTRQSYGEALVELGKENEKVVVLDADLATATKTIEFAKEYPDRFFDIGIAEADMIGTAAGMATCGKIPYASTFAVFAAGRTYDQIRSSVCYPNLNVKICATHAGVTVGEDGATHQMLEDLSLMRVLPNMKVFCPSDDVQTKWIIKEISEFFHLPPHARERDHTQQNSRIFLQKRSGRKLKRKALIQTTNA